MMLLMVDASRLRDTVEHSFTIASAGLTTWPDPYPDRTLIPDEAYSRVTNPERWYILAARTDAWLDALATTGLATVERDATITWRSPPTGPIVARSDRASPVAPGAIPFVIGHSRLGGLDDVGVVLAVGAPADVVQWFPDCGCDACDAGSQNELEHLDEHIVSIVTGTFRRLSSGRRTVTVLDDDRWSASNIGGGSARESSRLVKAALADPSGWNVTEGGSWFDVTS